MALFLVSLVMVAVLVAMMYIAHTRQNPDEGKYTNRVEWEYENEVKRIEAFIQAGLVGDQKTIDAINSETYDGDLPLRRDDGGWLSMYDNLRILKIAGINHRKGIGNYVGRIEVALVPEPTNEFDPYAIKIVAEDNHNLGYISRDNTDFVRSLTANTFPYHCTAFISDYEDEYDGHHFYMGNVYIVKNEKGSGQF